MVQPCVKGKLSAVLFFSQEEGKAMEALAREPSPELVRGVSFLCSLQRADGCIAGEVVWSPVITAQYVLVAAMISQPIEPQRQTRFLRYFRQTQTADGGWGLHPESHGYVFVTTLVYRSEEHTSELQSLTNLVCRLLLEKNILKDKSRHQDPPLMHPPAQSPAEPRADLPTSRTLFVLRLPICGPTSPPHVSDFARTSDR